MIDTNVLVAALKNPDGICAKILELDVLILISDDILEEVARTLAHPLLHIAEEKQEGILAMLRDRVKITTIVRIVEECRDPDDDKFLACVQAGGADCIVTGDQDLLVMHPWRGISILSPRAFLRYNRK